MFTCCPECKTCFRITNEQLVIAKGLVRCGHCHQVFNGSESLTEALPDKKRATPALDNRHEADGHDSSIFAAEFPVPEKTPPEHAQIENKDDILTSSYDHIDLPSFSARDDFIDTFTQNKASAFSPSRKTMAEEHSQKSSPPDVHDDLFKALTDHTFEQDILNNTKQPPTGAADQPSAKDTYEYSDISDALKEEQNIDDIFSDMHQQLELGMAELEEKDSEAERLDNFDIDNNRGNTKKETTIFDDEFEINQAIDDIFTDSQPLTRDDRQDDQEYRVEKEMLATFGQHMQLEGSSDNIKFEDEATSITDIPHSIDENREISPPNTHEDAIPRRLRDSLAIPEPRKPSLWKIIGSLLLILLLSVTLLIQLALFRNIEIIRYFPQTRPWLEQFCQYAPCRIQARQALDKIKILERNIRANPQDKKSLLITATIVNQANFSQSYPDIRVTLSDLAGTVVAQRRFTPADYLGNLNSPFLLMKSGVPVHIRIAVLDPGRDAVNFEFQFL